MLLQTKLPLCVAACLLVLSTVACATDDPSTEGKSGSGVESDEEPIFESALIPADQGGLIVLEDGATLRVPPNVLSESSEVTFTRHGCGGIMQADSFASCRYSASSDTASIDGRIEVSLPLNKTDTTPCSAQKTDDGWRCLADFSNQNNSSTATHSRFGSYAARQSPAGFKDQRCTDVAFTPCGGDIVGEWILSLACGSIKQITGVSWSGGNDPYSECGEFHYDLDYPFSADGKLSFSDEGPPEAGSDAIGSFEERAQFVVKKRQLISQACLDQTESTCNESCNFVSGICSCLWDKTSGNSISGGSWDYGDGGYLLIDDTKNLPYCVEEDRLTIQFKNNDGSYFMIYHR